MLNKFKSKHIKYRTLKVRVHLDNLIKSRLLLPSSWSNHDVINYCIAFTNSHLEKGDF